MFDGGDCFLVETESEAPAKLNMLWQAIGSDCDGEVRDEGNGIARKGIGEVSVDGVDGHGWSERGRPLVLVGEVGLAG